MSDVIKHECGIAMIRLRKPLQFYLDKYGTPAYAANKLYQHILQHRKPNGDGKGGTYFGATGCGKSLTALAMMGILPKGMRAEGSVWAESE